MANRTSSAMQRARQWLAANARRIHDFSLRPGASEEALGELEKTVGKPLPEDFKTLYRLHDGLDDAENLGSLFHGMDFLPLQRIVEETRPISDREVIALNRTDPAIDGADIANPHWIRFCFDASHASLCLDLAPAATGKYGQIIFVDDEYGIAILLADSTAQLLESFAKDLEQGRYTLEADALEDGNHYLSPDPGIDIVNWYQNEKWKHFESA